MSHWDAGERKQGRNREQAQVAVQGQEVPWGRGRVGEVRGEEGRSWSWAPIFVGTATGALELESWKDAAFRHFPIGQMG